MSEKQIMTVTGAVLQRQLGFCQSHEHILLRRGQSFLVNRALCMEDLEKSARELISYRAAGGGSIVDAQPVGCGRMARELKEVSLVSGVRIIASTGFHKLLFYPEDHWIRMASEEELAKLWILELMEGMYEDGDDAFPRDATKIRAGQIKTALDAEGLTERYEKLFRAACKAAKAAGAPIMVHVELKTDPRPLLKLLEEEQVPCGQVIFCHLDRAAPDLAIHKEIAARGAYLEYDTIGRFKYHSDAEEIRIMREMIRAGYAKQLLFSLDTTAQRLGTYSGGEITLSYILEEFIPALKRAGMIQSDIDLFARENPARVFARSI